MHWIGATHGPVALVVPGSGDGWGRFGQGLGTLGFRVGLLDAGAGADALDAAAVAVGERVTLVLHGEAARSGVPWAATVPERLTRVVLLAPKGIAENAPPPPSSSLFARYRRPHVPAPVLEHELRALARAEVPVVAIWGEADAGVPLAAVGQTALWHRAAKQEVIAGAGHDLVATHGASVIAQLAAILREDG